jgi:hypothetical protein
MACNVSYFHYPKDGGNGRSRHNDIVILNDGSITYHGVTFNKDSSIDLTLLNEEERHHFRWRAGTDSWGSDHFPIFIELNAVFETSQKGMNNRRLYSKETDWHKFSREVEYRIETAKDLHNGNLYPCIKYSSLTALLTEAVGEAAPSFRPNNRRYRPTDLTPPRKQPPPCPWWNVECDKLIRMRKAALRQIQYRGTRDSFINYKEAEAKARNGLK